MKSHLQRKHTEEKHESCDENEKDKDKEKEEGIEKGEDIEERKNIEENSLNKTNQNAVPQQQEPDSKFGESQMNNNNNDGENGANCTTCSEKSNNNSSSKAVQCEVANSDSQEAAINHEKSDINESLEKQSDPDLSQNAYQTISELKKEIVELKKCLETKIALDLPSEKLTNDKNAVLPTNDKIDVIEQKFNAFEIMYTNSQHQFIESFRNLDERQKVYMDNIQETIKEIVEKSLGQHELDANDKQLDNYPQTDDNRSNEPDTNETNQNENDIDMENRNHDNDHGGSDIGNDSRPKVMPRKINQIQSIESTSQSEEDEKSFVCEVEVHSELNGRQPKVKKRTKQKSSESSDNKITKDMAIDEFEQRLRQFGVDADSAGLNTPRSCEVYQDLAEEREEMKKVSFYMDFLLKKENELRKNRILQANKSFEKTRKKLGNEVDRIAKKKLTSASSVTSLSSTPYQSDEALEPLDSKLSQITKNRPKSASVDKMRKRNAKKLMRKFVKNDIDENDIIDKMQMAHKALNAHRECIQELLQTTTHSPSSLTKIKYSASKDNESVANRNVANSDTISNQYNKMPNITTRRVVFVNLDEDS